MDYGLWSNDEAWSNMQSQLLLTVGVWSLLCGENQPLLRLFVDLAHQQLLRARSKRLRANLHFPRKLIAVWNTSPVPFFFFFFFPQSSLPHPALTCLRLLWLSLMTMPELLRGLCLTLSFTGLTYVWTLCEWKGKIVVCIYFLATFFLL